MRIKLDENLSIRLKPLLHSLGHNIETVRDEDLLSEPDTRIASACRAEDRMLFTLDLEFADLRKYPPGSHPGIVLFRPESMSPLSVNTMVEAFVRNGGLKGLRHCVTIVEPHRIRVRKPQQD
ncbi:MAG: DUF5615 family PIN-like protein [Fibrobacterota bacterium]